MEKMKKFLYPFVFSAAFLILYGVLALLLTTVFSFPNGSYAPAALVVLFDLAWVLLALPIFCIRYSKIVVDEKLRFLFSAYNALLIIVAHLLPFNWQGETAILVLFMLWGVFWTFSPLLVRLLFRRLKDEKHQELVVLCFCLLAIILVYLGLAYFM
ncbi:MAG: hypothetical protein IJZ13_05335 [Clostridia bacterium]|nr:hypothetical protein [Clostridia bacterium]